jgi:hypothetical protein
MSARRSVPLPAAAAALLVLAGCSFGGGAARVAPPAPPAPEAELCAALHGELPERAGGHTRTDPEPRSELTAGWGGSAIVLRCGVPRPARMSDPQAEAVEADGVNWLLERHSGGTRFTTTYRKTYVEVSMDERYAHDATPLAELAAAVKRTVPVTVEVP